MRTQFWKMQALANDFMVIDGVRQQVPLNPERVRALSDRHRGVGFDQLLLLEPAKQEGVDFNFRIFNADGSEAEQCGNGVRCLGRFIKESGLMNDDHFILANGTKTYELFLLSLQEVKVNMQRPQFAPAEIPFIPEHLTTKPPLLRYPLETNLGVFSANLVSMGNPHCILEVSAFADLDIKKIGETICHHPYFPEQINVGFMQVVSESSINLQVYERGAGLTEACGSGACAAVVVGQLLKKVLTDVVVNQRGGSLQIHWSGRDTPVWMTGPAEKVFEGNV